MLSETTMHRIPTPSRRSVVTALPARFGRPVSGRVRAGILGVLLVLMSATALGGCVSDDPGLTVRGEVRATLAGGTSRFSFPGPTRLFDDRVAPDDGSIAGHCAIRLGRVGERDTLSFGISRTGPVAPDDRGLRQLRVQIDDPSLPRGAIAATFGASETLAGLPGPSCGVTVIHDADGAYATLHLRDCVLTAGADTALVEGSLEFEGCEVLAP
jgi:hypothetical protein